MTPGDRLEEVVAILVLGGGLAALALGYGWYWWVWVLGFVVLVPLVDEAVAPLVNALAMRGADGATGGRDVDSAADALETLRERYARGELTDAEFERKVERLVGTETSEDAELTVARDAAVADESKQASVAEPERE